MALDIKPLGDRVVVEPLEKDVETFAGGQLVLPDTAKEKPQQGKVLAVGPGRLDDDGKRIPMDVKVGRHGRVCQVQRHDVQDRGWQGDSLHEGERHPGILGLNRPNLISINGGDERNGKATGIR